MASPFTVPPSSATEPYATWQDPLSEHYNDMLIYYPNPCECLPEAKQDLRLCREASSLALEKRDVQAVVYQGVRFRLGSCFCPLNSSAGNAIRGAFCQLMCLPTALATIPSETAAAAMWVCGQGVRFVQRLVGDDRETACLNYADSCHSRTRTCAHNALLCQQAACWSTAHIAYEGACLPLNLTCPEAVNDCYTKGDIVLQRHEVALNKEILPESC